jgi:hypothetical protein
MLKIPLLGVLVFACWVSALRLDAGDSPPVILDLCIAHGAQLVQHGKDSIYARIWNAPALAALRAKLDEVAPQVQSTLGFDPFAVMPALISARLRVFAITQAPAHGSEAYPAIVLQVDVGSLAARLFTNVSAKCTAASVPGADEAITLPHDEGQAMLLARFGTVLVAGSASTYLTPQSVPDSTHDFSVTIDLDAIGTTVRNSVDDPAQRAKVDPVLAVLKPFLVIGHADIDVIPDGFHSTFDLQTSLPWMTGFDRSWLGHLPENNYACAGASIDGAALWHGLLEPLLAAVAGSDGKSAADVQAVAPFSPPLHLAYPCPPSPSASLAHRPSTSWSVSRSGCPTTMRRPLVRALL